MHNKQIAATLDELADLLEFDGANPFRLRAYRNSARLISELPEPITEIIEDPARSLTELPGIGDDLADKIETIVMTGTLPLLEEMRTKVPESVLALLRIPGLGPKRAATLFKELQITSLEQLRAACEAGKVRELKGFGAKTEETILAGLELAETAMQRMYWAEADGIVQELLAHMRPLPKIKQIEVAGSYRRGRETVGDLDVLVDADDVEEVMTHFGALPGVKSVLARGETKMSVRLQSG